MYFFNIKKLKKDLIEQKLTEKERYKYLFAMILIYFYTMFTDIIEVDKYNTDAIIEFYVFLFEIFLLMMSYTPSTKFVDNIDNQK